MPIQELPHPVAEASASLTVESGDCGESGNGGHPAILTANLPEALRPHLLPAVHNLVQRVQPQGLWLYGSWARGTASRRSDVDLLVVGLQDRRLLEAYEEVLLALAGCPLPLQPLVASPRLLARHGDAPFWRSVRADAIPLLAGSRFP